MINVLMIIFAFLLLAGYVFRENIINQQANIFQKTILGLLGGLMSIILVINHLHISNTSLLLEISYLTIVIIFYYAGLYPAIITSMIRLFVLILFYDIKTIGIVYLNLFMMLSILYFIDKIVQKPRIKLILYLGITTFMQIIAILILLIIQNLIKSTDLLYYLLVSFSSSIIIYYLINYIEKSNHIYKKYKESSIKDFLTGLYNTRQFDLEINKVYHRLAHTNEQLAIYMIDIDHFKMVNDEYGHVIGNEVLVELANIISQVIQKEDLLFRIGGEEFCLLSMNIDKVEAMAKAELIRRTIAENQFCVKEKENIHITVSIGLSVFPETIKSINKLKESADKALYNSKFNGRNKVSIE